MTAKKMTFGNLSVDEKFISFPNPEDYHNSHNVFIKIAGGQARHVETYNGVEDCVHHWDSSDPVILIA